MSEEPRRRVLLADDYPGLHPALVRLLRPECDVIGSVYDGVELLEAVVRLQPDVVVLDIMMPGIDGLHLCRRVKTAEPDVEVVVCTAADEPWVRAQALEAGASAFVLKSRMGEDLLPAIQRARSAS